MKVLVIAVAAVALALPVRAQTFDCQKGAAKAATKIGAYTFKQVCQDKGSGAAMHSVAYPQIVSNDAAAAKWNALSAHIAAKLKEGTDDYYAVNISYTIGSASAHLISVHFQLDGQGARAVSAQSDLNTAMPAAAPLAAGDLFKVTPQWKAFMAGRLGAAFKTTTGQSPGEAGIADGAVAAQAADPKYWFIDAGGLTIEASDLLPPPEPVIAAAIAWTALKPYLATPVP